MYLEKASFIKLCFYNISKMKKNYEIILLFISVNITIYVYKECELFYMFWQIICIKIEPSDVDFNITFSFFTCQKRTSSSELLIS